MKSKDHAASYQNSALVFSYAKIFSLFPYFYIGPYSLFIRTYSYVYAKQNHPGCKKV